MYFGSLADTLADVFEGNAGADPGMRTALLVGSGILLAVIMAWTTIISRYAQLALELRNAGRRYKPSGSWAQEL